MTAHTYTIEPIGLEHAIGVMSLMNEHTGRKPFNHSHLLELSKSRTHGVVLVDTKVHKVAGYVYGHEISPDTFIGDSFFIHPNLRNHGLGSNLALHLAHHIHAMGMRMIIHINADTPSDEEFFSAADFYARLGSQIVSHTDTTSVFITQLGSHMNNTPLPENPTFTIEID